MRAAPNVKAVPARTRLDQNDGAAHAPGPGVVSCGPLSIRLVGARAALRPRLARLHLRRRGRGRELHGQVHGAPPCAVAVKTQGGGQDGRGW